LIGNINSLISIAKVEPYIESRNEYLKTALRYLERCNSAEIGHQYGKYVFNFCKIKLMLGQFEDGKHVC